MEVLRLGGGGIELRYGHFFGLTLKNVTNFVFATLAFSGSLLADEVNSGGQLLMITSDSCPWCEAFEEEVGQAYHRTEDATLLPLRRHDFFEALPIDLKNITPATMTPTFIILHNGSEVGRIVGYPGAELFWWRLSEFVEFSNQFDAGFIKRKN